MRIGELPDVIVGPYLNAGSHPQINIATSVAHHETLAKRVASRLNSGDIAQFIDEIIKRIKQSALPGKQEDPSALAGTLIRDPLMARRVNVMINRLIITLAFQFPALAVKDLESIQKQGWEGGKIERLRMEDLANFTSYIKDISGVWLKTDLEAFALSLLRPGDWEAVHYICSRLRLREGQLPKFEFRRVILDKSLVTEQMQKTLVKFVEIAERWTKISSADSPEGYYERRAGAMMNRGEAELIGLRSDTYIPQKAMVEWTRRLGFPGLLQVIEIRNPESYLKSGNIVPTSGGRGHSPREYWLFPTAGPYIENLAIGQSADLSRLLPAEPGTPAPSMMRVTRTGENTFELLFDRQDEDRPYNIVVSDKPIPDSARIGDRHYLTFRRIHPLREQ